jgi:hypothetical protein
MVGVERFELRPSPKHYATNLGMGLSTNRKNRVLRAPATTFVITHSPSRSNDRDGLRFSGECVACDQVGVLGRATD